MTRHEVKINEDWEDELDIIDPNGNSTGDGYYLPEWPAAVAKAEEYWKDYCETQAQIALEDMEMADTNEERREAEERLAKWLAA